MKPTSKVSLLDRDPVFPLTQFWNEEDVKAWSQKLPSARTADLTAVSIQHKWPNIHTYVPTIEALIESQSRPYPFEIKEPIWKLVQDAEFKRFQIENPDSSGKQLRCVKLRLFPNARQRKTMDEWINTTRFIYNQSVAHYKLLMQQKDQTWRREYQKREEAKKLNTESKERELKEPQKKKTSLKTLYRRAVNRVDVYQNTSKEWVLNTPGEVRDQGMLKFTKALATARTQLQNNIKSRKISRRKGDPPLNPTMHFRSKKHMKQQSFDILSKKLPRERQLLEDMHSEIGVLGPRLTWKHNMTVIRHRSGIYHLCILEDVADGKPPVHPRRVKRSAMTETEKETHNKDLRARKTLKNNHLTPKQKLRRKIQSKLPTFDATKSVKHDSRPKTEFAPRNRINTLHHLHGKKQPKHAKKPHPNQSLAKFLESQEENDLKVDDKLKYISAGDPGARTFMTVYDGQGRVFEWGKGDATRLSRIKRYVEDLQVRMKTMNHKKRYRAKRAAARMYLRLEHLTDEMHRRLAKWWCQNYRVIFLPEFRTQGMISNNRKLHRSTKWVLQNWRHYRFQQRLIAKAREFGSLVVICNEAYTSKGCSHCGFIDRNLGGAKIFRCRGVGCGATILRDINGARNVFLRQLGNFQSILRPREIDMDLEEQYAPGCDSNWV
jgi:IS605 OrfB family transposase